MILQDYFNHLSAINEYEYQELAPRKGLAPPVLIFQTSPSCNIFTKIPNLFRNQCQHSHKGPRSRPLAFIFICNKRCLYLTNISPTNHSNQDHISVFRTLGKNENSVLPPYLKIWTFCILALMPPLCVFF